MSLDKKRPKGYRKAWDGGKAPEPPPFGTIRCRRCQRVHATAPPGWACVACGGEVSKNIGTLYVDGEKKPT